ncbi:MAG: prepilin peptidase [bacterium]|nr:prepilin peptidase [bacterium]
MESVFYIIILVFGLSIGSFMNAWVWRTREKLGITRARSICPKCRMQIAWYDNVPVLSFLILRGICRKCDEKIDYQYPLIEIWCGAIFLLIALSANNGNLSPEINLVIIRDWIIVTLLTFVFLYDLKYREILNFTTLIPGVILFLLSLMFGWSTWGSMLLGAGFGAGFFLFLYIISKGSWIGGGDVRLGFFMGIILGWPNVLVAFFISYLTGAVVSLLLIALKKKTIKDETAFGTYLVFGTIMAMFWSDNILKWYIGLVV